MKNQPGTNSIGVVKVFLLDTTGWLIPLVVSSPSLFIWAGLMTMPLALYLTIMALSIFTPSIKVKSVESPYFVAAIDVMLLGGPYWPDKIISILGIVIVVAATIHLNRKRKHGLVTSGPYRFVRNPQYFGAILFIINMTSRSYREVLGDVGWIGPQATLLIGFATLLAYITLASIEEAHLAGVFGETYAAYRDKTAFLIPFVVTKKWALDILIALTIPTLLFWALVALNRVLFP